VEEAGRSGILTYCMSLDPRADQYVSRIFGERNYLVVIMWSACRKSFPFSMRD